MTKSEFISQVADRSGISKVQADETVNAVIDTLESTLKSGGEVSFTGFGKFHVTRRSARQGINPQTGERIQIAAANVPKFTAGTALKKAVKESGSIF